MAADYINLNKERYREQLGNVEEIIKRIKKYQEPADFEDIMIAS